MAQRKPSRFEIRLPPDLEDRIDEWRRAQPDLPPRAEAARRLIEAGLQTAPVAPPTGADPASSDKPARAKPAPRAKPAAEPKAKPAGPSSKLDQIRALREQGAR